MGNYQTNPMHAFIWCVTNTTDLASTKGMGTARYYPPPFGAAATHTPFGGYRAVYMAIGFAMLSAVTVFLLLCERDHSMLASAGVKELHSYVPASGISRSPVVSSENRPAADTITRVTVPATENARPSGAVASEPDLPIARNHMELLALEKKGARRYAEFTLARSRRLQRVGSLSVGVWRIDKKRKLYDVSLITDGHRVDRKRLGLYSPISISSSKFAQPLQFVVNSVDRAGISGYVSEPIGR